MFIEDSFKNFVSGLGTDKDKVESGRFGHRLLSKDEIDASYQNDWLAAKIIDAPADDMVREWRTWNAGPKQTRALAKTEERLNVRAAVNRALKMARLYGGAAILIGDGGPDPTQPLDPASIQKGGIKYIHALSRWEIWAAQIDRDPFSPYFGEPTFYALAVPISPPMLPIRLEQRPLTEAAKRGQIGSVFVHPSRVVRFLGHAKLELSRSFDGWGCSVIQKVYSAIRNVASTSANIASMTYEAKLDVFKIKGLTQNIQSDDYRHKLTARFGYAQTTKSILNAIILDSEEEYEQKTLNFGQMPELLRLYLEVAAGAADIPATRLLGTAPKGMNATGASDERNYLNMLASEQQTEIRPTLRRLDECIIRDAIGARPDGLDYTWDPLWTLRENEQAAIALQKAQTSQIYATAGVMSPDAMAKAIQSQIVAEKVYPGMQDILNATAGQPNAPLAQKADETGTEINTPSARATVAKE